MGVTEGVLGAGIDVFLMKALSICVVNGGLGTQRVIWGWLDLQLRGLVCLSGSSLVL